MKLGDKIKVNKRFVRVNESSRNGDTKCTWKIKDIPEVEGIITGVRVISNGQMTKEGWVFTNSFKVLKVAISLKSEFYTPIQ